MQKFSLAKSIRTTTNMTSQNNHYEFYDSVTLLLFIWLADGRWFSAVIWKCLPSVCWTLFSPTFLSHFSKSLSALNFQSLCCSIPFSGKEFSLFRGFKGIKTYLVYTCVLEEYLVTRLEFTFCRTSVQQVAAARKVFFTCQKQSVQHLHWFPFLQVAFIKSA